MMTSPTPEAVPYKKDSTSINHSPQTVILSDVHLDTAEAGQERIQAFAAYLRQLANKPVERIILLGDLFDFWFEYRHVIFSGYFDVLRAFAVLQDQGVELHLVCGNHDFWAGRFLQEHLHFHVHHEPITMDFGGKRVLMAHGDGLNPQDKAYRAYKRIARAQTVIRLFRLIHPDLAMQIARHVSRTSRRLTLNEDPAKGAEAKALAEFARKTLDSGKADVVLLGHAHAPVRMEFPTPTSTGIYINTGDWMYHRSCVVWDGTGFTLNIQRTSP